MRTAYTRAFVWLAILLAWCTCAFGLDPSLDVSQYAHTSWKIRDGFVGGIITSIAQTPDGYLWLGTEFGLVRFDGARVVQWRPPNAQQLPSIRIRTLLVARDGTLWIGTEKGLASLRDGKLTNYPDVNNHGIVSLLQDREGTVWVGTFDAPSNGKLCAFRGGGIQCEGRDGLFGMGILRSFEDSAGNLWLGVLNGFWRWKPGQSAFFDLGENLSGFAGFLEDNAPGLLIGTSAGLSRLINGRIEPYSPPGAPKPLKITRMLRDHDGGLWIGTADQGLLHFHNGKTDTSSQAHGLSGDFVADLFEDREGDVWVVTDNGLDRFREYAVANVSINQGLSRDVVSSVLASKDGSVWISTSGGLSNWKDGQVSPFGFHRGARKTDGKLDGLPPRSLFQDSSGRIWVSTNREFGYLEGDKFIAVPDMPSLIVGDIVEVGRGHLWIRHTDAGLLHLFDGKIVQRIPWAGLGHKDFATALATDPSQNGLWIGYKNGGIAFFANGGIQKSYSAADGLGAGRVEGLRFGTRGALWAATEGGLSRIKDDHIFTLTSKNGLPCDTVHWSIEDDEHSVWLNTSCGLVRIEGSEFDAWIGDPTRRIQMSVFGIAEGVLSRNSPVADKPAVTKSPDGKIWFAGLGGVRVIDPRNLHFNNLPPPVHIEQVTVDDKPYDAQNGLRVGAGVHYLTIDYTALSLVDAQKVRFRYKLEGFDSDWQDVGTRRQAFYTKLPPKDYRFRVLACNNSGVWNEEGASLNFTVPPAWYQTMWFYALCVLSVLTLLLAAYKLRMRQLAYQFNLRLEERVSERTRLARDLHDTLLQSFQALLPRFQIALYKLADNPAEARKTLEQALDMASDAIGEGRDAIKGLRESTVEKNDLAEAIRTIGEELANADSPEHPTPFHVLVEGTPRNLHPILRDEVYRLAAEALRNAFKHAAAHSIEVEIRYDVKYLRLRVRDDGKGISPDVLSGRAGHYGLPGMKERAALVGGKLTIWSEVDNGTEVELVIPASKAYATQQKRFWYFRKSSATESHVKETSERE